jgi:hypothetical protein
MKAWAAFFESLQSADPPMARQVLGAQIVSTPGKPEPGVRVVVGFLWALAFFCSPGCVSSSYQYGRFHPDQPDGFDVQPVAFEYGEPNKTLDRIGYVVGFPARLLTLNKNVNNHHLSPETLDKLRVYLEENDITDVYVVVDKYDPKDQWRRLRDNDRISPFWRYSVGAITCIGYTILPNRIFGGDRYNPFTNTLNLSSDVPAMVLAEAAYAKDIHSQRFPGFYASIVNDLPILTVFRQTRATSDVVGYARIQGDWATEKQTYLVMYPQIGVGCIGPIGFYVPVVGPFLDLGGAVAGHVAGRTVALVEESRRPKSLPDTTAPGEIQFADRKETPSADGSPKANSAVMPASFEEAQPTGAETGR